VTPGEEGGDPLSGAACTSCHSTRHQQVGPRGSAQPAGSSLSQSPHLCARARFLPFEVWLPPAVARKLQLGCLHQLQRALLGLDLSAQRLHFVLLSRVSLYLHEPLQLVLQVPPQLAQR
jgi:hypothetical protein